MSQKFGSAYVIALATTSLSTSTPTNIFPFVAGSATRVLIDKIEIGIVSSLATAFGVKVLRGSTTPLSTSAVVTPTPIGGWSGHATAGSYATAPTTTLASTTSAALLDAGVPEYGYSYEFEGCGVELAPNQRLDVVITAPIVPTVYASMRIREIGKNPLS
jgi:hypothetical protein